MPPTIMATQIGNMIQASATNPMRLSPYSANRRC